MEKILGIFRDDNADRNVRAETLRGLDHRVNLSNRWKIVARRIAKSYLREPLDPPFQISNART